MRSPGTDARDEAAVLLQVVGRLRRVEDDRRVEEREEDDESRVEKHVGGPAVAEIGREHATMKPVPSAFAWKLAIVAGSSSSEEAKIGGITPEVFSLSGRNEVWPSYIRLPTWRFG